MKHVHCIALWRARAQIHITDIIGKFSVGQPFYLVARGPPFASVPVDVFVPDLAIEPARQPTPGLVQVPWLPIVAQHIGCWQT